MFFIGHIEKNGGYLFFLFFFIFFVKSHPTTTSTCIRIAFMKWFLYRAQELPITIALDTLNYLNKEDDYLPWSAVLRELGYLDDMLSTTEIYGEFQVSFYSEVFFLNKEDFTGMCHGHIWGGMWMIS